MIILVGALCTYVSAFSTSTYANPGHPIEVSSSRKLEIRYIMLEDPSISEVMFEDKTYKLFNTKKEAIDYAAHTTDKTNYLIVYVRANSAEQTTEIIELPY